MSLSKSRFLSGSQCEKKLYFDVFRSDLKQIVSKDKQHIFNLGHRVGAIAQTVFAGGVDATPAQERDFTSWLRNTQIALSQGTTTIYEAAFSHEGCFAAIDILHLEDQQRWAIEVKSSTSVKDYHITDAAFQYMLMNDCGFRPDGFFIMHINSDYVLDGPLDKASLFNLVDITEAIIDQQPMILEKIEGLQSMLDIKSEPTMSIGPHCDNPFACEYKSHCWKDVPQENIFSLPRMNKKKAWELYEQGIVKINDLTDDHQLSTNQQRSVNIIKSGEAHIDRDAIQIFLEKLNFPLSFFDFETIVPCIPIFQGTKPYQQLPFQFSLHVIQKPELELEHFEYLADESHFREGSLVDPLEQIILAMTRFFPSKGSIMAYNMKFEKTIVSALSKMYPKHSVFLNSINDRMIDLLDVFSKGWYQLPEMYNSSSIKVVLPAIAPDRSYDTLDVGNGLDASQGFQRLVDGNFDGDSKKFKHDLLNYCKQDTEGMAILWKFLNCK